jgi:alcohol dehydrogenase YqhD (iron-dependent ADH family)
LRQTLGLSYKFASCPQEIQEVKYLWFSLRAMVGILLMGKGQWYNWAGLMIIHQSPGLFPITYAEKIKFQPTPKFMGSLKNTEVLKAFNLRAILPI